MSVERPRRMRASGTSMDIVSRLISGFVRCPQLGQGWEKECCDL